MNRHVRRLAEIPLRVFAVLIAPVLRQMARGGVASEHFLKRGVLPVPLHFYQPIFDPDDIPQAVWQRKSTMPGVDFRPEAQLSFLERLAEFSDECRWPELSANPHEYYSQNSSFGFSSACLLHCMVRLFCPARVIEIGAGMSTLVLANALDVNRSKAGRAGQLTTIDPYLPETLDPLLPGTHESMIAEVQAIPLEKFTSLKADDLLFIDSSHVVRTGGDVNFLYLDVLPQLAPGVLVHIHDIQLPYEYHRSYSSASYTARLFWTEQYLLQAFLALNNGYRILLAGYWLQLEHPEFFKELFPTWRPDVHRPTTSFYLQHE